jgi:hypothetical protein
MPHHSNEDSTDKLCAKIANIPGWPAVSFNDVLK